MARRERNQSEIEASSIETRRGMIGPFMTHSEQMRNMALCQGEHGRGKCQVFQLIRVFGTHSGLLPVT